MMLLNAMGLGSYLSLINIAGLIILVIVGGGLIAGTVALVIYLVNRHRMKKWLKNKDKNDKDRERHGFDTI